MNANNPDPDESAKRPPRLGLDSILAVAGLLFALGGLFFQPELPSTLHTPLSVGVFIALMTSVTWLVTKLWHWRQTPDRRRPRGLWAAALTSLLLAATLAVVVLPEEEMGLGSARCDFGLYGLGVGMVWVKVEPADPGTTYDLTITWSDWIGKPDPRPLHKATYFTFLKRDFASPPADVTVTPDAELTCGDGRPPQPSVHLDGDDWQPRSR